MGKNMVVLVGIPGAGKTWVAESLFTSHVRISIDQLKRRSRNDEDNLLIRTMREGRDVVVDTANVTISKRRRYLRFARKFGYTTFAVVVDTSIDLALARNQVRERKVPEGAVWSYAKQLQWPTKAEGFKDVITLWDDWDPRT